MWPFASLGLSCLRGGLFTLLGQLSDTLSAAETQACKALLLPRGQALDVCAMLQTQPLSTLIAKVSSGWLQDLLDDQALFSHYQPIVKAADPQQVVAYEALLRAHDHQGQLIPPGRLFDTARSAELLFQLDRDARIAAIRGAVTYQLTVPLFINFNPTAIYDPEFCLRTTNHVVQATGIKPERIVFEVIESEYVKDTDHLLKIAHYYRREGYGLALDDLGAGYGSLNLLSKLQPDYLKFDRELIYKIDENPYKQEVFSKLLDMARGLGVKTIGEGVETIQEYRWLVANGADYVQGYLFAKPAAPPPRPAMIP